IKKAVKFVKKSLSGLPVLKACEDRTFYAVGGTWRSFARLHMWQTGYPLHVMHGYAIRTDEALEFARLVHRVDVDTLANIEVVNSERRPLLPYAALVLASRLPRRAIAQHHRAWRFFRYRSSGPRLSRAGGVLPPCRPGDGRRTLAAATRACLDAAPRPRPCAGRGVAARLCRVGSDA